MATGNSLPVAVPTLTSLRPTPDGYAALEAEARAREARQAQDVREKAEREAERKRNVAAEEASSAGPTLSRMKPHHLYVMMIAVATACESTVGHPPPHEHGTIPPPVLIAQSSAVTYSVSVPSLMSR